LRRLFHAGGGYCAAFFTPEAAIAGFSIALLDEHRLWADWENAEKLTAPREPVQPSWATRPSLPRSTTRASRIAWPPSRPSCARPRRAYAGVAEFSVYAELKA